jgi:hypothetical protein
MGWRELLALAPALTSEPPEQAPAVVDETPIPAPSSDPDWIIVKHHIRERLIAQRRALETRGMSLSETEGHRHAIFELEGVLNCLNPSKMQSGSSE